MPYQTKVITSPTEITQALELVYEVYCKEMNWKFDQTNASNLKKLGNDSKGVLLDDYTNSSVLIGVYDNETLCGCLRLIPKVNGKFEIECYQKIKSHLSIERNRELNRIAIRKDYRDTNVFIHLLLGALEYAYSSNIDCVITTAHFPEPGNFCLKMGMTVESEPFKYSENDPYDVHLFAMDLRDKSEVSKKIRWLKEVLSK